MPPGEKALNSEHCYYYYHNCCYVISVYELLHRISKLTSQHFQMLISLKSLEGSFKIHNNIHITVSSNLTLSLMFLSVESVLHNAVNASL